MGLIQNIDFQTSSERFETVEQKNIRLTVENKTLVDELAKERIRYSQLQTENHELNDLITTLNSEIITLKGQVKPPKKAKVVDKQPYSEFKSDGKRKAHSAEPIRSYEDFTAIQNYFLDRGKIRDWTLWTIGVSLGLRISDLLSLRFESLLKEDKTFRARLLIREKKTSKLNNCLITESVRLALTKYLNSINWKFKMNDFIFQSSKTKSRIREEYGWKIISDAGKALNLPFNIGSHTMRKSFANIAACVDKSCIDMNAITKIQGLLNHSDQKVTMRYLGTYQTMFDKARNAVSNFVLGKTDVHELVAGNNYSLDDVMIRLERIEKNQAN